MNILEAIVKQHLNLDKDKFSVCVDHVVYEDKYDENSPPTYSGYFWTKINNRVMTVSPDYITLKEFISDIAKLKKGIY